MAFLLSFHVLELIAFTFKAADIFVGSGRGPETELPHGKKMAHVEMGLRKLTLTVSPSNEAVHTCAYMHTHIHTHTRSPMLCSH